MIAFLLLHIKRFHGDNYVYGGEDEDEDGVTTDGGNGYKHGEPFCLLLLANLPVFPKHPLLAIRWVVIYNCGWGAAIVF